MRWPLSTAELLDAVGIDVELGQGSRGQADLGCYHAMQAAKFDADEPLGVTRVVRTHCKDISAPDERRAYRWNNGFHHPAAGTRCFIRRASRGAHSRSLCLRGAILPLVGLWR